MEPGPCVNRFSFRVDQDFSPRYRTFVQGKGRDMGSGPCVAEPLLGYIGILDIGYWILVKKILFKKY